MCFGFGVAKQNSQIDRFTELSKLPDFRALWKSSGGQLFASKTLHLDLHLRFGILHSGHALDS